ncbi:MAG: tRNA (adenosine(37)-N6)-threonylcarbamoyltransferase complex transferase subunit TsaD [Patescibacteria group bacterium]
MNRRSMNILGIETSCDDTGVAIVKDGYTIVDSLLSSQDHVDTGGVVPEKASRMHIEVLPLLIDKIIKRNPNVEISKVAVTLNPGLVPALLVGVSFAHGFAKAKNLPIININHLYAHVYANILINPNIEFPHISLLISGGHTQIIKVISQTSMEVIGQTLDDAAGEAFDKVARMFDLPYPGGPHVSRIAESGDEHAIDFPRPMVGSKDFNFSFSGLKTSVLYYIKDHNGSGSKASGCKDINREDVLASFEYAVADVLVKKTIKAARTLDINTITIAGGVASNLRIRKEFEKHKDEFKLYFPPIELCTDNAVTVAGLAYHY